ncbi:MAG: porin family protein [Bacteroidales bacterium]
MLLCCLPALAFAQTEKPRNLTAFDLKTLHFGFTVGLNAMDLGFQRNYQAEDFIYADLDHLLPGFQVSIVSDLRLNKNWNLRFLPGISFGSREVTYYSFTQGALTGDPVDLPDADNPVALGPSNLDFPLHLKYRSDRLNNGRPYLVGGLNFRYDMSARKAAKGGDEENEYLMFKPGDLYLEFGFGVDTYLRYFKFAPELKLGVGLRNILVEEGIGRYPQFVESLDRVNSFIIMLNFHFE